MIDAKQQATVNLAALDLIENMSAAYYGGSNDRGHERRAHEALRKIANALGYRVEPIEAPALLVAAE